MRRAFARLVSVAAALVATVAPARGAPTEVHVGARVGYVVGRGWTLGPEVGFGELIVTGHPFGQRQTSFLLGLTAAGDLSFGDDGQVAFRAHVGPELAAYHDCPVVVVPVGAGLSLSFERGSAVAVGGYAALAALFAPLHPVPTYNDPAPAPTFLAGVAYRAAFFPASFTQNELALAARLVYLPGSHGGLGYCGGD
jgi:hypothetical protein